MLTAKLCSICQRRAELADSPPSRDHNVVVTVPKREWRSPCCYRYHDSPRSHYACVDSSVSRGQDPPPPPDLNSAWDKYPGIIESAAKAGGGPRGRHLPAPICYTHTELLGSNVHGPELLFTCLEVVHKSLFIAQAR